MKTKFFLMSCMLAFAACILSCNVHEFNNETRHRVIHATIADNGTLAPVTRTQIVEDGSVYWEPADKILAWNPAVVNSLTLFEATCTIPSSVCDFETNNLNAENLPFALYSGNINRYLVNDDGIADYLYQKTIFLDSEQSSFNANNLMLAYCPNGGGGNYSFRNVCSGLKFSVEEAGIISVSMKGNNNEDIAGYFTFDFLPLSSEQPEVLVPQGIDIVDGEKVVTVTSELQTGFPVGEWIYLLIIPTRFEQGITITLTYSGGKQSEVVMDNCLDFKRNVWKKAANLDSRAVEKNVVDILNQEELPFSITPVYDETTITIVVQANTIKNLMWSNDNESWSSTFDSSVPYTDSYGSYQRTTYKLFRNAGETVFIKGTGSSWHGGPSAQSGRISVDKDFYACGNIMSLLGGSDFVDMKTLQPNSNFQSLFSNNTTMLSAPLLPATKLSEQCYSGLFAGCSSLKQAPALPATVLENSCYQGMFSGCTLLESIPELPADRVKSSSYKAMFKNCTSLTEASIPAITVDALGCEEMFYGCTSLERVTIEAESTLTINYPFRYMFQGCSSLSYIKCAMYRFGGSSNHTNNSSYYTYYWVDGVAAQGTFVRHPDASWNRGKNGIPSGWEEQVIAL